MSYIKPIKLYGELKTANPWKVAIILEELSVPWELKHVDFADVKKEPYTNLNPNGRVLTIEDPNTGITLWESGAIIEYLSDQYDKDNKISYTTSPKKYQQSTWKHFQMSGQGPYFGQLGWFALFHPGKNIASAIDRYKGEVHRVMCVIDSHLSKTGNEYLVGDKACYADLMFLPWNVIAPQFLMGEGFPAEWQKKYPRCHKWHQKLLAREGVQRAQAKRAESMASQ